jgi:tagatose 1,6-diphosphate aldolase
MSAPESPLPKPPDCLEHDSVSLRFSKVVPGDATRGFVPYYHFRIFADGADIGHINLRVGDTEHVRLSAGHIGYEISAAHRGHRHALSACRALAPFARSFHAPLILTCDPDNLASRRTIELLGATFIDEIALLSHDPHYLRGSRTKLRFQWKP